MSIYRVMSFNVLNNEEDGELIGDSPELWVNRSELCIQTIKRYEPGIIGFQEYGPMHQASFENRFPEYKVCFDTTSAGIGNTIYFQPAQFDLLDQGNFWLTRTPDRPDPDWGLEYALGVSWLLLRHSESGIPLIFMNTQYEDGGEPEQFRMREEGCKVHLAELEKISQGSPGAPVIMVGDFNHNIGNPHYNHFIENGFVDTYRAAGNPDNIAASTFHGFRGTDYYAPDYGIDLNWRVDWILTRDGSRRLMTVVADICRDAQPPLYPSDHYPIVADLRIL